MRNTICLCFPQAVYDGDEVTQRNERARSQDECQHTVVFGVNSQTENLTGTQQLTHGTQQRQTQRKAQAHAYTIEHGSHRTVLGGKRLGASQQDTVHHNQRDEG